MFGLRVKKSTEIDLHFTFRDFGIKMYAAFRNKVFTIDNFD